MKLHKLLNLIKEQLNEAENDRLASDVVDFVKKHLRIKSDIVLKHKPSKFNSDFLTQQMASVGQKRGGKYEIYIDFKDTKFGFVRRLVHELVHVKQMESGKLKISDNNTASFNGKVYTMDDYKRLYHSDEMPEFEEEAFDKERLISNLYWNRK